jgi:hypothetical protein
MTKHGRPYEGAWSDSPHGLRCTTDVGSQHKSGDEAEAFQQRERGPEGEANTLLCAFISTAA